MPRHATVPVDETKSSPIASPVKEKSEASPPQEKRRLRSDASEKLFVELPAKKSRGKKKAIVVAEVTKDEKDVEEKKTTSSKDDEPIKEAENVSNESEEGSAAATAPSAASPSREIVEASKDE